MTPAIQVADLVKQYPKRPSNAVDGLSFTVEPGEIFGLLGPNGAGKTTTVGILTTLVVLTSGTARLYGVDVAADPVGARRLLAMVPQRNNLDRSLTARQNLLFHAAYHGVPAGERRRRADELLDQFGLGDRGGDKVVRYSGGQVQRLMIARALMHQPAVLFLDEPSTGLDPQARVFVWDRIRELRGAGVTILLTTHDMDEAAELSDRVGIMDHGTLLALDAPTALTRALPGDATLELSVTAPSTVDIGEVLSGLSELTGVQKVEQVGDGRSGAADRTGPLDLDIRLYLTVDGTELVTPASAVVAKHGARVLDVAMGRASLEDVFFSFTGRGLR
ncbi:MAG TPA: ATP-binding cassette domain-containing protein [Mycobacteriales bacterium]|nr:ATP-binding cassette domain-containing protein [Mycobacteriales bacterium]